MKTVVILALPRSGSSLLAGVMHLLGVWMGNKRDLLKGKSVNKYGSYENQDFLRLSFNIIAHSGGVISWTYVPDDEKISDTAHKFVHKIERVINRNKSKLWGWKDPFVIYSIPHIHQYLENPHYICMKRDVDSVVNSQIRVSDPRTLWPLAIQMIPLFFPIMMFRLMFRWLKFFADKGNLLRNKSLLSNVVENVSKRIDHFVKDKKHITIQFKDLINHPKSCIDRIVNFLNIKPTQKQYINALRFIRPEIVHF